MAIGITGSIFPAWLICVFQATGIDDKKDYEVVNKAMKMIGFSDRERETVWKIVAVIIHLVSIGGYLKC